MTEPLVVDPARLKGSGIALQNLDFPGPPPPMVVPGTDPVSAAVNATLPIIESPVIDGLPAVKAVVKGTGSSIVAAAEMYAEADQALGEHVGNVQFLAAAGVPVGNGAPNPLGQLGGIEQAVGPITQDPQAFSSGVQQATGSMGNTRAAP